MQQYTISIAKKLSLHHVPSCIYKLSPCILNSASEEQYMMLALTLPTAFPSAVIWPSYHPPTDSLVPEVNNSLWVIKATECISLLFPLHFSLTLLPSFPSQRYLFAVFSESVFSSLLHSFQAVASLLSQKFLLFFCGLVFLHVPSLALSSHMVPLAQWSLSPPWSQLFYLKMDNSQFF